MKGEKIFEFDLDITGVTDYGVSMDAILSGKEKIPPQGACFEVAFKWTKSRPSIGASARYRLPPGAR